MPNTRVKSHNIKSGIINGPAFRAYPTSAQTITSVRIDGANGTGECMIVLYKNGAEHSRGWNSQGTQFAANFWSMGVADIVYANGSSDYFEIYIQQSSGVSLTTTAYTNISYFSGCMIRGA
jgi:hypothetical protein